MIQRGKVAFEEAEDTDDQQSGAAVDLRVVRVKEADEVLDLLVRDDAADEEDVCPVVVELTRDEVVGRQFEVREVRHHGEHCRPRKSEAIEVFPVEG